MPLTIQHASAGSGKTEQLARHYLKILFSPDAPGYDVSAASVLATTFTREAAGEILTRIFKILATASLHDKLRLTLFHEIGCNIPSADTCRQLLRRLVEQIDQLAIGTIDALFAQQGHALALDLGLAPNWTITDSLQNIDLARKAAAELLEKKPKTRQHWRQLHDFTRQRSFIEKAAGLFEAHRYLVDTAPICSTIENNAPPLFLEAALQNKLLTFLDTFETPLTSKKKPDARWAAALTKLRRSFSQPIALKNILSLSTLLAKCLPSSAEEPKFNAIPIPSDFLKLFSPLAIASSAEQERLELLREQALAILINDYDEIRQRLSFCSGSYTFSEIEEALQPRNNQLSREEIELRMESRIEHLLLDEYQDTSQRQHDFLSPLVGDVLAKGGNVFVVGDVKQGIYGWRGGKRHLLGLLGKEHAIHQQEAPSLNLSYRSSQAVLDAVNEVFGALKNSEALERMGCGTDFLEAAKLWSADFQPHRGAQRVEQLSGRVHLHEVNVEELDAEERMEKLVVHVVSLVEQHRREDPLREIAILVRRTKLLPPLLRELRHHNILASGEGGNPLTDTIAVETLLSLLAWIDHPGHTAACEQIKYSPLADFLTFSHDQPTRLRAELVDKGYADFLRKIVNHPSFHEACSEYELARIEQLLGMAEQFDMAGGGHPSDFMKRVRTERVESPVSSGVRVLTFHAAKGLEFETVILIDLDTDIFANHGESIRIETTDDKRFFIRTNQELMERQGRAPLLHNINKEQWAEAFSLLYVGMTRAACFLDLVFFGNYKRRSTQTMAAWLRASGLQQQEREGLSLKAINESSQKNSLPIPPSHQDKECPEFLPIKKLLKRSPSNEKEAPTSLEQKLKSSLARQHGTAIHALLSQISWANNQLTFEQQQLFSTDQELASLFSKEYFLKKWDAEGVTQLEVWHERRFAVAIKKELISGAFDRVVIGLSSEGIPIIAEIIDFKTDAVTHDEEKKKRAAEYASQLHAYREALKKLLPELTNIETKLVWIGTRAY